MVTVAAVWFLSACFLCFNNKATLRTANGKLRTGWIGMLLFLILFVFTTNNPDYKAYELAYKSGNSPFAECFGFVFFAKTASMIGIRSYSAFLFVIGLLIVLTVRKWDRELRNIQYVVFFYSLFVMYYDVIQIRNMIASFCMLSVLLLYLFMKKGGWRSILMLVLTAVAFSFHPISALLLIIMLYVVLCRPKNKYKISPKEVLILTLGTAIVLAVGRNVVVFLGQRFHYFWKISIYMTTGLDWKSFLIWLGSSSILLTVLYTFGVRHLLSTTCQEVSTEFKGRLNILFRFALFGLVLSPLTLYMDEIVRMYRFFYMVIFIIYAMIKDELRQNSDRVVFSTITIVNLAFMVVWMLRGVNFDKYW